MSDVKASEIVAQLEEELYKVRRELLWTNAELIRVRNLMFAAGLKEGLVKREIGA